MIKVIFIVYEIALIAVEIWLCYQMKMAHREYKAVKKRYCLAPKKIKEGHTYEPTKDESGSPFTAAYLQSKGDVITDLHEDLAAEQKARTTYDNILRLVDDPDVREPIKFLREREIVHYQRFGEGLRLATDKLNEKNFYAFNPSFDVQCNKNCCRRDKQR